MWERRSYGNILCTVKFCGTIEPWGDQLALGVEWDDPKFGKNNGDVKGIKYFTCAVPGAGSFIKASRKYDEPTTFGSSFENKYLTNPEFEEISLTSTKKVETYDVDTMYKFQSTIENLTTIALDNCKISSMNTNMDFQRFVNLTKLDLGHNLISDFPAIANACDKFPKLQTLRLDGNRFDFRNDVGKNTTINYRLKELSLNNNLLTEENILEIVKLFPNLHTLSIAFNQLNKLPGLELFQSLPHLHTIDLSHNLIKSLKGGFPSKLSHLIITDCKIEHIHDLDSLDKIPANINILRNEPPLDWESISALGSHDVTTLNLNLATSKEAETHRAFIIARCPKLKVLDGTPILDSERLDAELYTRSCVLKGTHSSLPKETWHLLNLKYGDPMASSENNISSRIISIYLDILSEPIKVLRNSPMYRLGWIIARLAKISDWSSISLKSLESGTLIPLKQGELIESCLQNGQKYQIISNGQNVQV